MIFEEFEKKVERLEEGVVELLSLEFDRPYLTVKASLDSMGVHGIVYESYGENDTVATRYFDITKRMVEDTEKYFEEEKEKVMIKLQKRREEEAAMKAKQQAAQQTSDRLKLERLAEQFGVELTQKRRD